MAKKKSKKRKRSKLKSQMTLSNDFNTYLLLARGKYKDDWAVQTWLDIYYNGTKPIKTKNKKISGISPKSEFSKMGLMRAIDLRERGVVFSRREKKDE